MNKKILTILLLSLAVIASGCTQPASTGQSSQQGYALRFRFEKGTALFSTTRLTLESNGQVQSREEMKTLALVKDANQEAAALQLIALSLKSRDKNGERDKCSTTPLQQKRKTVTVYPDGNADFGNFAGTTFHLPLKRVKIGEEWKFEGIDYKIEKPERFENAAGSFNCLKISFNGIQSDKLGTKWLHGYFLFDPEKELKVKEKTVEERATTKTTIETEITKIEKNYSQETDYSCLYPSKNLAMPQKFMAAINYFRKGDYLGALQLSRETKKDLEAIKDLNSEETQIKKNTLSLLALCYERLHNQKRALNARFEAAEYFYKFLDSNKIDADDFKQALEDYHRVAEINNKHAAKAAQQLSDLNSMLAGWLKGKALLSDTGEKNGFKITLFTGRKEIVNEMRGTDEEYNAPVLGAKQGGYFGAIFTMPSHAPKAIPALKAEPSTLSKEHTVILKKTQDQNKGFLAGFCYTPTEKGNILHFNDQNVEITSDKNTFCVECKNGFYSIQLEPGTYTLQGSEKTIRVKAGTTTIAHAKIKANN